MLDFTYNMPPSLDRYLRVEDFPVEILLLYLSLVALYCVKKLRLSGFCESNLPRKMWVMAWHSSSSIPRAMMQ